MSFIEPDDYIILFDLPDHASSEGKHQMPLDDMKRLRDVSVKTVLQLLSWRQIEKKLGERCWDEIDGFIAKARAAGMKTLLMTYDLALECGPEHWYARRGSGRVFRSADATGYAMLSPWNAEAMAYSDAFVGEVLSRYAAPDVCCIGGLQREGEWVLPPRERAYFDDAAIADFRRWAELAYASDLCALSRIGQTHWPSWAEVRPSLTLDTDTARWLRESLCRYVVHQQRLLAPQHGEIWGMLQHLFDWDAGNFCSDDLYAATRAQVKATLYNIQFVHFPHGERIMRKAMSDSRRFEMPTFAGSEWPEGLLPNTPRAIHMGLRGLITAPLHPLNVHRKLEKWMVDAFAGSIEQWKRAAAAGVLDRALAPVERFRPRLRLRAAV